MDCLGYSPEAMEMRVKMYEKWTELMNERSIDEYKEFLFAGSKSEGTSSIWGSDFDLMLLFKNCICVDDGHDENDMYVVLHYSDQSPPGYTKLRPLNFDDAAPASLRTSTVYDLNNGIVLLSSATFQKNVSVFHDILPFVSAFKTDVSVSGPALCALCNLFPSNGKGFSNISFDLVYAMRFYSVSILKEWQQRKREHEWPTQTIIQEVSSSEGYIVPVGPVFSEEQNLEWRICYATAERLLFLSLKEEQKKLYVILKILNKHVFEPSVNCVSSYMLKNTVLWIAECTPAHAFTPFNLIQMLMKCLFFLLHCLNNNFLPNYMIPRRNLFLGKVKSEHKQNIKLLLRELLKDRERVVLRCPKISIVMNEMIINPLGASSFRIWRNKAECLLITIGMVPDPFSILGFLFSGRISDILPVMSNDETYLCALKRLVDILLTGLPIYDDDDSLEIVNRIKELFSL